MPDTKCNLLWVDDDAETILSPFQRPLLESGIDLDVATSFEIAESKLCENSFSALLTDVILPSTAGQAYSFLGLRLVENVRQGKYSSYSKGTRSNINIVFLSMVHRQIFMEIEGETPSLEVKFYEKDQILSPGIFDRLVKDLFGATDAG